MGWRPQLWLNPYPSPQKASRVYTSPMTHHLRALTTSRFAPLPFHPTAPRCHTASFTIQRHRQHHAVGAAGSNRYYGLSHITRRPPAHDQPPNAAADPTFEPAKVAHLPRLPHRQYATSTSAQGQDAMGAVATPRIDTSKRVEALRELMKQKGVSA